MSDQLYPSPSRASSDMRKRLAPETHDAFQAFGERVFAEEALSAKTKQLIAVAVAHATQCPYCIRSHTKAALRYGAAREELMEAIWVAAEMRAGGAYAHSILAVEEMDKAAPKNDGPHSKAGVDATAQAIPGPAETAEKHRESALDEALEESFPGSDPVAPMRFT